MRLEILLLFSAVFICLFYAHGAYAVSVIATIPSGNNPHGVGYDSAKGEIFVTNGGSNSVSVISDTNNTVVKTIPVGTSPYGVAYDFAKGEIFVANFRSNSLSVISDTNNTVVKTISTGHNPHSASYDSAKGEIFVTNAGSNSVSVISDINNTVVATIPFVSNPTGAAYDASKGEIFVTNFGSHSVSVISDTNNTVVATIPVGTNPEGISYDFAKGEIFVTNAGLNSVSVISDTNNTVVATIPVGTNPEGISYDSAKGEIFVANSGSNSVSVISDINNTVVGTITVGVFPTGVAYDSAKGEIFVTNFHSNSISVLSDATNYHLQTNNANGNCETIGGAWSTPTCTLAINFIINSGDSLTIDNGVTLTLTGAISNFGTIYNNGTIINNGVLNQYCGAIFTSTGTLTGNAVVNLCSSPTVSFDQAKYVIENSGYVTVNDASKTGSGSVNVHVNSTSDATGLTLSLTETPSHSGIFTNLVTFTASGTNSGATPPALLVGPTDSIFASYAGATTVQSQVIESPSLGFGGNSQPSTDIVRFVESDTYQLGQAATLQVNDLSSTTVSCPAGYSSTVCVQVKVTSNTDATGIVLYLTQNSVGSHLFTLTSPGLLQFLTTTSSASTPSIKVSPTATVPDVVTIKYPPTGTKGTAKANIVQSTSTTTLVGVPPTTIPRASCAGDSDGDGICDSWETATGISVPLSVVNSADTGSYTITCNPNAVYFGATGTQINDPLGDQVCPSSTKKDVYVQVDYMQGQTPNSLALQDVVNAFRNSPVSGGINLHIFLENPVPWQKYTYWSGDPVAANPTFMSMKQQYFGSELATCPAGSFFISQTGLCTANPTGTSCPVGTTLNGSLCTASPTCKSTPTGMTCSQYASDQVNSKRQFFHYAMFQYDQDYPADYQSSGTAQTPGNDFVVTLGEFAGHVGSIDQQAGTFMHELGHNLGLRHGGADDINCKANYPSVMNYMSQFNVTDGGFVSNPLDFSRAAYSAINEKALSDTSNGITNPAGASGTTAVRAVAVGGFANGAALPIQTYSIPAHVVVPPTAAGVKIIWDGAGKQTAGPYTQNTRDMGFYGCTDTTVGATSGITTASGITLTTTGATTGSIIITQKMTFSAAEVVTVGVPSVLGQNTGITFSPMYASVSPGSSSTTQTVTITVPFSTTAAVSVGSLGTITVPFTISPSQISNPTITSSAPTTSIGTLGGTQTNTASMSATLNSYNDWTNLIFNFRGFSTFDDSQRVTSISLPPDEFQSSGVQNPGSITPAPGSITVNAAGAAIIAGQTFSSPGSFVDPNSASWTGMVDYGDGSGSQALSVSNGTFTPSHVYSTPGNYQMTVNITSNTSLTGSGTATVNVQIQNCPVPSKGGANSKGTNLSNCNFAGYDLSGANLQGANLSGANLQGANLSRTNMQSANLQGANLQGANLSGANLQSDDLSNANLQNANFTGSKMQKSNLSGSNLTGAILTGANVQKANLQGAITTGITPSTLAGCINNSVCK